MVSFFSRFPSLNTLAPICFLLDKINSTVLPISCVDGDDNGDNNDVDGKDDDDNEDDANDDDDNEDDDDDNKDNDGDYVDDGDNNDVGGKDDDNEDNDDDNDNQDENDVDDLLTMFLVWWEYPDVPTMALTSTADIDAWWPSLGLQSKEMF